MTIPWSVRKPVRRLRNAVAGGRDAVRQLPRWRAVAATPSRADELAVSYGVERMALADDVVYGGAVKFQLLHEQLPNAPRDFNVLYLGSSSLPAAAPTLVRLARRRSAAFVWNQNGVAYPGWYGNGWELVNAPRARLLHEADHVFFQSAFCKVGADRYYGERQGPWEVLHNPVDTQRFRPPEQRPARPLTLLLGGNQYQRYRLLAALDAFALVRLERPEAKLLVAGALSFAEDGPAQTVAALHERGLAEAVELVGPYTQREAPSLLQRADLLLHTKYNDPCPTIVLEALACGLPVVYSATGGVPELVSHDAGVGIPAPLDWEHDHPPAPAELAAGVLDAAERLEERSEAARTHALRFDSRAWIARHRAVFEELVHPGGPDDATGILSRS